jgi:hypothetical protein
MKEVSERLSVRRNDVNERPSMRRNSSNERKSDDCEMKKLTAANRPASPGGRGQSKIPICHAWYHKR